MSKQIDCLTQSCATKDKSAHGVQIPKRRGWRECNGFVRFSYRLRQLLFESKFAAESSFQLSIPIVDKNSICQLGKQYNGLAVHWTIAHDIQSALFSNMVNLMPDNLAEGLFRPRHQKFLHRCAIGGNSQLARLVGVVVIKIGAFES